MESQFRSPLLASDSASFDDVDDDFMEDSGDEDIHASVDVSAAYQQRQRELSEGFTEAHPFEDALPMDLKARETQLILQTLRTNEGHRQKTAEDLNISPRTLRYKLAKLKEQGIDVP